MRKRLYIITDYTDNDDRKKGAEYFAQRYYDDADVRELCNRVERNTLRANNTKDDLIKIKERLPWLFIDEDKKHNSWSFFSKIKRMISKWI